MAKIKFDTLNAAQQQQQQQSNTIDNIPTTPSTSIKFPEATSSQLNLNEHSSIDQRSITSKIHGFIRQSSFPSPMSPFLSASASGAAQNTRNAPDNKSGRSHSSDVVRRVVSYSLEKSVFKILNNQDWNILHERDRKGIVAAPPRSSSFIPEQSIANKQIDLTSSLERLHSGSSTPVKKFNQSLALSVTEIDEEEALLSKNNNECTTTTESMLVNRNGEELDRIEQLYQPNESAKDTEETSLVIGGKRTRSDEPHFFIEEAIKELLKSRRILRCSYVYGYYLDTFGHKKFIFELIQTEFEGRLNFFFAKFLS
jgi:hypothetical protein